MSGKTKGSKLLKLRGLEEKSPGVEIQTFGKSPGLTSLRLGRCSVDLAHRTERNMHQVDDTNVPKTFQAWFAKYWGWGWEIKAGINCHCEVLVGVTDRE